MNKRIVLCFLVSHQNLKTWSLFVLNLRYFLVAVLFIKQRKQQGNGCWRDSTLGAHLYSSVRSAAHNDLHKMTLMIRHW